MYDPVYSYKIRTRTTRIDFPFGIPANRCTIFLLHILIYDLRQEESYSDCGIMQIQRYVLPYLQHLHNVRELSTDTHPCNSNLGSESIRIFRKEMTIESEEEFCIFHTMKHLMNATLKWRSEGGGAGKKVPFFIADASGVIMITAQVWFATVKCFCKEMAVLGQVGGEPGVCKQTWLYRKPFPVVNLSDSSHVPSSSYI